MALVLYKKERVKINFEKECPVKITTNFSGKKYFGFDRSLPR